VVVVDRAGELPSCGAPGLRRGGCRRPPLRLPVRQPVTARLPFRPQRMRLRRQSRRQKPHAGHRRNQNR